MPVTKHAAPPTSRTHAGALTVRAYAGDAKTLLAFDIDKAGSKGLAGFTIHAKPPSGASFYLFNTLQFEHPGNHAQDISQAPNSSINAPIHKFRWLHVPGSVHTGIQPALGKYTYTVTPRYFDGHGSLLAIDPTKGVSLDIDVVPFKKGNLQLGFTRGFVQSQGFVRHFGKDASIRPKATTLLFDTSLKAGTDSTGADFTFAQEYSWSGFTARKLVFEIVNEVLEDSSKQLDMLAYDLNEPDLLALLLRLAEAGRIRLILDNAPLHHNKTKPKPEDQFETLFNTRRKGNAELKRGHFKSFAHDKVMIVKSAGGVTRVLTGSTNFSITGLYVNSNHVLVFSDATVARKYADVFEAVWTGGVRLSPFVSDPLSKKNFPFPTPDMNISFAPHDKAFADTLLGDLASRVTHEGTKGKTTGSVLFAIMDIGSGTGPVRPALESLHANTKIFSYGVSDTARGIRLYAPGHKTGVLVTGKPLKTKLPPPFNQVPGVGKGHQIHHKFVVCGFNTPEAVVYCGSSNLAAGGEQANGDNLLEIHDPEIATVFAIEAVALVDHFAFLDRYQNAKQGKKSAPPASKQHAAVQAKMFLSTDDSWAKPYFDASDLRSVDRELFA